MLIFSIPFAVFNLIPFPPLDGSKILGAFLSQTNYSKLLIYERFGFPILLLLSFTGALDKILRIFITPVTKLWLLCLQGLLNLI